MITTTVRGRRLARFLTAGTCLALAACSSGGTEPETFTDRSDIVATARAGQELTLAPGMSGEVAELNLRIRFADLSDSRCPTKALIQCVWAGSVRVQLLVSTIAGDARVDAVTLETVPGKESAVVRGHTIRLLRVTPEKETTDEIPKDRYRIVLQVGNAR